MTLKICKWLFLLLIVSLPLVRPFNTLIFGLRVPFTDFIFLAVFLFWAIALTRGEAKIRFDRLYLFIGLYALALTISTVFSVQPTRSLYKLLGEFYLFALFVLTFNLVRDKSFFQPVVSAWLCGTVLTVLASAAGFFLFYLGYKTQGNNYFLSHFGSLPAGNYPRLHALFANANVMTNFLNVSLILTVLAGETGWWRKIWSRILQIGIWFAAIFTFSAGLGGMVLSLGIWFWAIFRNRPKRVFPKIVLAGAIIFALAVFSSTLVSPDTENSAREFSLPFSESKFEPSVRVLVWENSLENFQTNPFIGKGTGTDTVSLQYRTLSGGSQILLDSHNIWLNVLGQTGLLGLAAFFWLTIRLIKICRFGFDVLNERNSIHLAFSAALMGAFLYQGLTGSFEDARHLWILFGLLAGVSSLDESRRSPHTIEASGDSFPPFAVAAGSGSNILPASKER